jgi:peptidoglycan/LPS O-acetylase OafA/YrhL
MVEARAPRHDANAFDALRLAAACSVVLGHAYVLSGRAGAEPLVAHTGLGGFGEFGVSVFFVISGYLVFASFARLGSTRAYLAHRCLRILPGLAAATALTALVLGPLVSTLPAPAYFARAETWLYPLRNVLLYPVTYALPGVFEHNPYPEAVNGSLWTLRLEFTCYLLIPLLAWMRLTAPRRLAAVALLALFAYWAALAAGPRLPPVAVIAARNGWLFLAGAALQAWGARAPGGPVLAAAAAALLVAGALIRPIAPYLAPALLPLVVVAAAWRAPAALKGAPRFGDLSYGIYIYAFPVQQALMLLVGPQLPVPAFVAATLAGVLPLALASWWLVERPALRLKRRTAAGPPAVGPAAATLPLAP